MIRPRMDRAVWEKTAPETTAHSEAEVAAAKAAPTRLWEACWAAARVELGRHGRNERAGADANVAAWRRMFHPAVTR